MMITYNQIKTLLSLIKNKEEVKNMDHIRKVEDTGTEINFIQKLNDMYIKK